MLDLVMTFANKAILVALCALYVHAQLSVHRGFDLAIAGFIVVCADLFIWLLDTGLFWNGADFVFAVGIVVTVGVGLGAAWGEVLTRLTRGAREPGYVVLLASLGLSILLAALVGLARGPGLLLPGTGALESARQLVPQLPAAPLVALILLALGLVIGLVWISSTEGLKVSLLAQDRSFTEEIGVDAPRLAIGTGAVWGGVIGLVACSNALLAGNTPDSGMPLFIFGACAALVSQSHRLSRALSSGMLIGFALVATQLFVSPSWSEPLVFMAILLWIIIQGTSRNSMATR